MIIIKQLKHNRFENVSIPKAVDLFKRVGKRVADSQKYSGDEYLSPTLSKVEAANAVMSETEKEKSE